MAKEQEKELTMEEFILKLYREIYLGIRAPQDAENLLRHQVAGLSEEGAEAFRAEARKKGTRLVQCAEALLSSLTMIGAGK